MKWFRDARTVTKLLVTFALPVAALVALGYVSIRSLAEVKHAGDVTYQEAFLASGALGDVDAEQNAAAQHIRASLLAKGLIETNAAGEQVKADHGRRDEALGRAAAILKEANDVSRFNSLRDHFAQLDKVYDEVQAMSVKMQDTEGSLALDAVAQLEAEAAKIIDEMRAELVAESAGRYRTTATDYARTRLVLIALIGALSLVTFGIGFVLARAMSRPLVQAVEVLEAVAGGDFTRRLELAQRDEVGQLAAGLNSAVDGMRRALGQVRDVSETVASAANQLSATAQSISAGAQQQASSLEESAASIEEMTATVKHSADNARQASQLALGSRETAERGGQVVAQAVTAMTEINQASRKISEIIVAIDEIAFQTNLLALNAAVEAARAGEQGRGFAVVAGEVRSLAQRSATAAREIKALIADTVQKVDAGTELVNRSGVTLDEIVASVKRVTDIVAEIASSAREQSTGIEQINTAITQMDQVTQSSAGQTRDMSGTANDLTRQSSELAELVARFRLGDGDHASARTGSDRSPASDPPPAPAPRATAASPRARRSTFVKPPSLRPAGRHAAAAPAPKRERKSNGHNGHNGHNGVAAMDSLMADLGGNSFEET